MPRTDFEVWKYIFILVECVHIFDRATVYFILFNLICWNKHYILVVAMRIDADKTVNKYIICYK